MEISADSPIFLDTNILMYQSIAESPFHRQAAQKVASLEKQGFPLGIAVRRLEGVGLLSLTTMFCVITIVDSSLLPHVTQQI